MLEILVRIYDPIAEKATELNRKLYTLPPVWGPKILAARGGKRATVPPKHRKLIVTHMRYKIGIDLISIRVKAVEICKNHRPKNTYLNPK